MGRVKRSNALSSIFMRYVLVMLGSLVGVVIVAYLLLYLLISAGCIDVYKRQYYSQNRGKIRSRYNDLTKKFLAYNDSNENSYAFLREPQFEALEMRCV